MIRHMLNHNGARWLPSETRPRRAQHLVYNDAGIV
jgi:hypothetical protein